jgi:hypothetical protein
MKDSLRALNLIPIQEPYAVMGYLAPTELGTIYKNVLSRKGDSAIVDWVWLELRHPTNPQTIIATKAALVQKNGYIVTIDGVSDVPFEQPDGLYHLAIRHRNHLGVMTASPAQFNLNKPVKIDFTKPTTPTYGTNTQVIANGVSMLWSGDINRSGSIKYNGSANDRNAILSAVGLTTPDNSITGYRAEDVNLDGVVKYNGTGNDRSVILQNVGLTTPNSIVSDKIPRN